VDWLDRIPGRVYERRRNYDLPMYLRARSGSAYFSNPGLRQLTCEQNLWRYWNTSLSPRATRDRLESVLVQMGSETVRTSKAVHASVANGELEMRGR